LVSEPVAETETECIFETSHDLTLWPIVLAGAQYLGREVGRLGLPPELKAPAAIVLSSRHWACRFRRLESTSSRFIFTGWGSRTRRLEFTKAVLARNLGFLLRPSAPHGKEEMEHTLLSLFKSVMGLPRWDLPTTKLVAAERVCGSRAIGCFGSISASLNVSCSLNCGVCKQACVIAGIGGRYYPASFGVGRIPRAPGQCAGLSPLLHSSDQSLFDETDHVPLTDLAREYRVIPDRTRPTDHEVYQS